MVEMSKKKCRRDYLWQRLLTQYSETESQGMEGDESSVANKVCYQLTLLNN